MFVIIPDIHGNFKKLKKILQHIGCYKSGNRYKCKHKIVFLGDLIDTGTENYKVIETVNDLIESGIAECIMGNHEYNAIQIRKKKGNDYYRVRSNTNLNQHEKFIEEFGLDTKLASDATEWFKKLPLFFENEMLRAVHAYPNLEVIKNINRYCKNSRLKDFNSIYENHQLKSDVELLLKGPEIKLKKNSYFYDYKKVKRTKARVKWWSEDLNSLHSCIISVSDKSNIENTSLTKNDVQFMLEETNKVTFFGHYKLDHQVSSKNYVGLDVPKKCLYSLVSKDEQKFIYL